MKWSWREWPSVLFDVTDVTYFEEWVRLKEKMRFASHARCSGDKNRDHVITHQFGVRDPVVNSFSKSMTEYTVRTKGWKCAEIFKQTNNQIKLAHQPRVQHLAKSKANPTSNHSKTDVRKIVTKHVWQDMVSPAAAVPPPVWSSRFFILRVYHVSYPAKSSNTLSNRKGCDCFFCKLFGISTTA